MAYEMDMEEIKKMVAELGLITVELDHLQMTIRAWQARSRELMFKINHLENRIALEKTGQVSQSDLSNAML